MNSFILAAILGVTWLPQPDGTHIMKAQPTSLNTAEICFYEIDAQIGPSPITCVPSDGTNIAQLQMDTPGCHDHVIKATGKNDVGESMLSNEATAREVPCVPLLVE